MHYDDIIMAVPMCMYVVPRLPARSITMAVLVVEVVVSGSVALRCAISWHAAVRAAGIVMANGPSMATRIANFCIRFTGTNDTAANHGTRDLDGLQLCV